MQSRQSILQQQLTTALERNHHDFTCLHPLLDTNTYLQFQIISQTLMAMTGRITMLCISRWTKGKGGSYRTIKHFFTKDTPWSSFNWAVAKVFSKRHTDVILIAGDATTVTKAGKETFGLGIFFSSIYSRAVPGIAFHPLLLLNIEKRSS